MAFYAINAGTIQNKIEYEWSWLDSFPVVMITRKKPLEPDEPYQG
jgi:hypothetical protein